MYSSLPFFVFYSQRLKGLIKFKRAKASSKNTKIFCTQFFVKSFISIGLSQEEQNNIFPLNSYII